MQMPITGFAWRRTGRFAFTLANIGLASAAAALSWHLVDKHALALKDFEPARHRLPLR